jgi:phage-related tail protein
MIKLELGPVKSVMSVVSLISAIIATVSLFGFSAFITSITSHGEKEVARTDIKFVDLDKTLAEQNSQIMKTKVQLEKVEQHLASLSNIPKEDALNIEIQKLSSALTELASKEAKIESVILNSPSKALEIPLLRRDIDNIKAMQQSGIAALKDSIDRIYDISKWLLGAMAISILTLAIGNLLKSKDTKAAPD